MAETLSSGRHLSFMSKSYKNLIALYYDSED